jgi:predicted transcriptional regulator
LFSLIKRDFDRDAKNSQVLMEIMLQIDGKSSVLEIAKACNVPFGIAKRVIDEFCKHGLIEYAFARAE